MGIGPGYQACEMLSGDQATQSGSGIGPGDPATQSGHAIEQRHRAG
jgi:hypothetical protein